MHHVPTHDFNDQYGVSIKDRSHAAPMLLILLRHLGCSFCRRTLQELKDAREEIERHGYTIGIVHMDPQPLAESVLEGYGLSDLSRYYDPGKVLYEALEAKRMPLRALFSYRTWVEGLEQGKLHGISWPESDPLQLPGAFLIDQGTVIAGHTSLYPAEPPDFRSLVEPRLTRAVG